ncbi:DNA-formamidopyrimidine glycosylase family protein [Cellulosimicrobium marinum]|uniref:DNA-formamidopyrimidine glycosylase family protein n=1 Tax=Cellulosimicrobium marinum TaxID=1638992 RepID=UPI001E384D8E|nr:DNA-formamidopyrimidine glycosylase family protein [Cellulosimicrobium marinum]MCB7137736.1 Fpg/Nei family DNA glycosylase [Cellulosimicrobium marinum]
MPEGDVVRITATRLGEALTGRALVRAELRWPSAAEHDLVGRTVVDVVPYGKHLLTRFDDGWTLHTHLRMEGEWHVARTGTGAARGGGPTVRVVLANAWWTTIGVRIGMLHVLRTSDEHRVVGGLGPDVLADDFLDAGLGTAVQRLLADDAAGGLGPRHRPERAGTGVPVAEALLDQHTVAGLGTIWTAESLHARRVWPWTPVRDVPDLESVLVTARELMARTVRHGFDPRDGYVRHVHGRAGRACHTCGTPVAVGTANEPPYDRPIFWCPGCQPPPG